MELSRTIARISRRTLNAQFRVYECINEIVSRLYDLAWLDLAVESEKERERDRERGREREIYLGTGREEGEW